MLLCCCLPLKRSPLPSLDNIEPVLQQLDSHEIALLDFQSVAASSFSGSSCIALANVCLSKIILRLDQDKTATARVRLWIVRNNK